MVLDVKYCLMPETFGQLVKRWLEQRGLNQAELARRSGYTAQYISYIVRDYSPSAKDQTGRPDVEVVDKIAKVLSIPLAEARLAAGYAPPGEQPETSDDARGCAYLRGLPPSVKADAVALLEALWRRHGGDQQVEGSKKTPGKEEAAQKQSYLFSTGIEKPKGKRESRAVKRDKEEMKRIAREHTDREIDESE